MAFDSTSWRSNAVPPNFRTYSYSTTDPATSVLATGYFTSVSALLRTNDRIWIEAPTSVYAVRANNDSGTLIISRDTSGVSADTASVRTQNLRRLQQTAYARRYDNPRTRSVMASPPTIAVGTTNDASLTNEISIRTGTRTGVIRSLGGYRQDLFSDYVYHRTNTVSGSPGSTVWSVECMVDADVVQFGIYAPNSTNYDIRFIIDGQYASLTATQPVSMNTVNYIKLTFGSRAVRHIIFEAGKQLGFRNIKVGPTSDIYLPPRIPLRGFWQGESFMASNTGEARHNGIGGVCARALGIEDYWVGGVGGTGWLADSGTETTFRGRNQDIITANPDFVFICGGHNDRTASLTEDLTAEVATWIQETRAALPYCTFFVTGPWPGDRGPDSDTIRVEAEISAGVVAANDPGTIFIPISDDPNGSWVTGTGNISAPTSSGNSDVYTDTDAVHPSAAGYVFLGERLADAVMRAVDAKLVEV